MQCFHVQISLAVSRVQNVSPKRVFYRLMMWLSLKPYYTICPFVRSSVPLFLPVFSLKNKSAEKWSGRCIKILVILDIFLFYVVM